jgi:homoserine O-acetyltransferase
MSPPSYDGPPPATGAWQEGDHPGRRRFVDTGPQDLDRGGRLPAVRVAYETWGEPRVVDGTVVNAVLVLHALTGDSHVSGPAEDGHPTAGWWDGLVGPGRALDPAQWFVVAPNVLGGCQGTTGPSSRAGDGRPYGSRWPGLTVRDQVETERRLADALDVRQWQLVVGGSMGGYRALEWAVGTPDRVAALALVATTAAASADQLAVQSTQLLAITGDPAWRGGDYHSAAPGEGPHVGLGLARRIAHVTYRTGAELETRFGNDAQTGEDPLAGGRYAVQSYLDHHAHKLARRFDAGTYVSLTDAMNHHDVGRGPRWGRRRAAAGERPHRRRRHRQRPALPGRAAGPARGRHPDGRAAGRRAEPARSRRLPARYRRRGCGHLAAAAAPHLAQLTW